LNNQKVKEEKEFWQTSFWRPLEKQSLFGLLLANGKKLVEIASLPIVKKRSARGMVKGCNT